MGAAVADFAATERPIDLDLAKVIPRYKFSCFDNDAGVKGTRTSKKHVRHRKLWRRRRNPGGIETLRLRSLTAWGPDLNIGVIRPGALGAARRGFFRDRVGQRKKLA